VGRCWREGDEGRELEGDWRREEEEERVVVVVAVGSRLRGVVVGNSEAE